MERSWIFAVGKVPTVVNVWAGREASGDYSHTPRAQHLLYHSLPQRLRVGISKASKAKLMLKITWFTGLKIHSKPKWALWKFLKEELALCLLKVFWLASNCTPSEDSAALPPRSNAGAVCVRSRLMYRLLCSQAIGTESFYLLTQHLPTQRAYCIPVTQPQLWGCLCRKILSKVLPPSY